MSYTERKELFEKIEELRERPLITYVTSIRPGMSGHMAGDSIEFIIKQIQQIPEDKKEIDFLIISNGGDPITALRIISLLRERFEKVFVLLPYVAYSAATILSLGADEIIMHPYSNLGPVDPQLTVVKRSDNGQTSPLQFSSEDIRNYIEFAKNDVGITDQEHLTAAFNALAKEVGPLQIGYAKRGQQLSLSSSAKMLETHMADKNKAASIAKMLNTSYYHHGYAVGRSEAKEMGLNVVFPDKELADVMWAIWQDYSHEMKCSKQFSVVSAIMNDPVASAWYKNVSVIDLPANTPPQIAQNIIANAAQQAAKATPQPPIMIKEMIATIESSTLAVSIYQNISITYWRDPNMALAYNTTPFSDGWEEVR